MPISGVPHTKGGRTIYAPSPIKGFPDVCGVFNDGRMFAFELKAGSKLSPKQIEWQAKLKRMNCVCHVVRSLDDVIDIITGYLKGAYDIKIRDQYE